ncbi:tannase/feruloyl esterase family alpha/beta hydrolase [Sphingobium sufflavum]|uniref:tannase/feruloyl esterase family alpha/beta hydrolase n=1 Tax=Sphingobium sufflavum TaxID=1129547 RepID=UPI001F45762E|nr:tannase/feruloyl esterase family alpha/beta hydrolase [Sphingobium sufflavum]MCE7797084.1 tannase/feruloyl esterase family alpha/beta hydrolase [Sphingobium sufflavum]
MRVSQASRLATMTVPVAALTLAAAIGTPALAAPPKRLGCDASIQKAFKPDALTRVIAVKTFRKGDDLVIKEAVTPMLTGKAASDLCLVKLIVGPGTPGPKDAPSTSKGIGIEIWLPTPANWNGRLHNIGGRGGYDGGAHTNPDEIGWAYAAATAGTEGAISASTDSGHALSDGSWAMLPDGTPNRQGWTDFAHRAQHEVAVKTKALALAYYGRLPKFAYYEGASTGGRHGYALAQNHPDDYDGIIATLPTLYFQRWALNNFYHALVIERDLAGAPLSEDQQDLVSNAAIRACDVVGGEHLGYIMDNAACHYDPAKDRKVLCSSDGGDAAAGLCVTRRQAQVVNKWWYGITADGSAPDPAQDNGVGVKLDSGHRWYGFARGTSLYLAYFTKLNAQMIKLLSSGPGRAGSASGKSAAASANADMAALALQNPTLAGESFRNASGNGQDLWKGLSYAQMANAFDRATALDPVFGGVATDKADLSAFKASGGKFLSWHGWNDESIPVQHSMRYYDEVAAKMGGYAAVQDFYKLYLVPGGGHTSPHGTANPDANPPAVAGGQMYKLMTDWVEKGIAPDRVEIQSPKATPVTIHQPLCQYPLKATYVSGDPKVSASFICS